MVKPSTIFYLAIACVVIIFAALAVNGRSPAFSSSTGGQLLFPGLNERINEVARITVTTTDGKLVVARNDKGWVLASKGDFPAKYDMVRQTLLGLAQERTVEAKTGEPSLYSRLEVEDPTVKDSRSALVTLEDAKGAEMASLILGKHRYARAGKGPEQIYVRKPGEARSWLAEGPLERNDGWKLWADGNIISLERDGVAEVDVTPADDKPYRLTRDKPGDGDFALQNLPPDQKVKDLPAVNAVASALSSLKLNDVMAESQLKPDAKWLRTLAYRSFDGLVVEVSEYRQDNKSWFKFAASYDAKAAKPPAPPVAAPVKEGAAKEGAAAPPASEAPKAKSADDVKREAAEIEARTQAWLYELAPGDAMPLEAKFSDLIEPKEPPKPKG